MKRLLALAVLAFFCAADLTAGYGQSPRTIDLNKPGAFDALQLDNPQHYEKINKILDGLVQQLEVGVPHWIQTNFDARDVQYSPMLLTSYPPQKHFSFTLDDTHYRAVLTLTRARAEIKVRPDK